jgi:hypothetical protein
MGGMKIIILNGGTYMKKHPKCAGQWGGCSRDYDCGYSSVLVCDECKYGTGRKDPEAKCNQIEPPITKTVKGDKA